METDSVIDEEPTPMEYAALERECEASALYRQRVAGAALQIARARTRMSVEKISQWLGVTKTTAYRIVNGQASKGMNRIEFDGMMWNISELIERHRRG